MRRDAELAVQFLHEEQPYRIGAMVPLEGALLLQSEIESGDATLAAAVALYHRMGRAATGTVNAIAHRSWLARRACSCRQPPLETCARTLAWCADATRE